MLIKGTQKPQCKLCKFFMPQKNLCIKNDKSVLQNDSCTSFSYDIFKYKPHSILDVQKYKKEDFEI